MWSRGDLDLQAVNRHALARAVGISVSHASMILNRKRKPGLDVAARVARHLGVSLDQLWKAISAD